VKPVIDHDRSGRFIFLLMLGIASGFTALAFIFQRPVDLLNGMGSILTSTSQLISDYFQIGGVGAAFLNAASVLFLELLLIRLMREKISGLLFACLLTTAGFAFFGTNLLNVTPVIGGVFLYGKIWKVQLSALLPQAFFATTISPITSFIAFGVGLPAGAGLLLGIFTGLLAGIVIPPLAAAFLTFHQGYSLYNVGFTAGVLAIVAVSIMRLFHIEVKTLALLYKGDSIRPAAVMAVLFILITLFGLKQQGWSLQGYAALLKNTGRLSSDFIQLYGCGPALVNTGIMGLIGLSYVLLIGAQVNGPVIGGLLTLAGFSAFGKHPKNSLPVLAGTSFIQIITPTDVSSTSAVLASLFGTTLAPVSGACGPFAGIAAGMIHAAVTANIISGHGGINLYNNGLAGGFVAGVMIPVLDSLGLLPEKGK
jgi:hypothetical protein